ncbi:MAG: 2-C-methyl-D-erythritol 4-phosphate cytidylyltransferase, partial [Acutalibacteraceae bacterium]
ISSIPNRAELFQGQTPQSFKANKLKNLYESLTQDEKDKLTDACKIFSIKGEPVHLVQGEVFNMKITYPFDLRVAQTMIEGAITND